MKSLLKNKQNQKAKEKALSRTRKKSAQEWLPVRDIRGGVMLRRDKNLVAIIKIEPVNLSLLSQNEKKRIISILHEVINAQQEPMQWLSIGRSVDLDGYIARLEQQSQEVKENVRKKLLKGYIRQAAEMAAGGETLERRFYVLLVQNPGKYAEKELLNRARELAGNLQGVGLGAELCDDRQILDLLFSFHQPSQASFERVPDHVGPYLG